jgi:hypothetical protein
LNGEKSYAATTAFDTPLEFDVMARLKMSFSSGRVDRYCQTLIPSLWKKTFSPV